ncbi:hypothetical protein GF339_14785 [candidate division KSB3 bacterium]|uniref:Nucleotidyl transferase AbiEii/AbiGii toxin family protein n=1 Tax=candidate division KSB3 bacterium TaxID=2044937 RepID=A0A9D5JXA7_9BACT|nr:hypothetical protein [candidate division KSB3 bacterium]MBD3325849.1 hypothetical protein [candidate division KSB3 bacterium]
MNGLFQAALEVQQFFQKHGWSFCVIGGLAVIRWGEVRMTQDVDLTLFTGFGAENAYVAALLEAFQPRIPQAEQFAVQYRVLLISAANGTPVDISLAGLPFEQRMIARATPFAYTPECSLLTCSAEDLIVLKAFADRPKDWMDVEGIVMRQGKQLDVAYIVDHLTDLAEVKGDPTLIAKLRKILFDE